MNDSLLTNLLELARSATNADQAWFVLADETERLELCSPSSSSVDPGIEQPFEPMVHSTIHDGSEQQVAIAPVIGSSAETGWIAVKHQDSQPGSADQTLTVVTQIARLIEERLDRDAEQLRLDEIGELLRDNQERLHITRDELSLSNRELEQFAYIAAHELVAPLRAVAVYAEILESVAPAAAAEEPAVRNCVNEIRSGVQQMTRQVQALLELSNNQLDADSAVPIELNTIVNAALDTLAQPLDEAGAQVSVDPLPTVLAAPVPLQSVFANLFSNAIRYRSPDRPLRVQVTATQTPGGHRIEITDNGSGVAEVDHARIFEMFERASTSEDGSGIGLALSRKIVNLFGAKIGVEPSSTDGSVFWLEFPAVGPDVN